MNTRRPASRARSSVLFFALFSVIISAVFPDVALAQTKKKNPASKLYVADVSGETLIDTGEALEEVAKRSVYSAEGVVIETKAPEGDGDRSKNFSTVVYSNGTGAFFDADTRVEVRSFVQEPFTPNRSDIETEPSISQTKAFLSRGTIGLCNSKLVAGTNMIYQTPQGSVSVRGRKLVIEVRPDSTKVSMIEGDSTVRGGTTDVGGQTIKVGEQAIIRPGPFGQPSQILIQRIPPSELPLLDDKVAMACLAKRSVYFDVRERTIDNRSGAGGTSRPEFTELGTPNGAVAAFDGSSTGTSGVTIRELVPVEIVPVRLPVESTISPARILTVSAPPGS